MITVDDSDPTPAFEQIRAQLAGLIRVGSLDSDQRLPSVRQLAKDLGIAPGTVARAYAQLEAEGLVDTSRGGGTRVRMHVENHPDVLDAALDYVALARDRHLGLGETLLAVRAAWASPAPPRPPTPGS